MHHYVQLTWLVSILLCIYHDQWISYATCFAQRFPRPGPGSPRLIPGGMRIPSAAGGCGVLIRSTISTLALATPMAGTTQVPQLHCMPAQANLPTLYPHVGLGQVKRPDNGPLGADVSVELGKRDGRIQESGFKKTWAHSAPTGAFGVFSSSCGTTEGVVASVRLSRSAVPSMQGEMS